MSDERFETVWEPEESGWTLVFPPSLLSRKLSGLGDEGRVGRSQAVSMASFRRLTGKASPDVVCAVGSPNGDDRLLFDRKADAQSIGDEIVRAFELSASVASNEGGLQAQSAFA